MILLLRHISFIALLLLANVASAANNAAEEAELPKLAPPTGEMPPTFWEQSSTLILIAAAAFALMMLVMVVTIYLASGKRSVATQLPEVQARNELKALSQQTETGATLTKVSQSLRRYFISAFELPRGEYTTAEFCKLIGSNEKVGGELSSDVATFLKDCDVRKFSPAPASASTAANSALALVERGVSRQKQSTETGRPA